MDELNPVLDLGLLPVDEVVKVLKSKPEELEIIATGRGAPLQLLEGVRDLLRDHTSLTASDRKNKPESHGIQCGKSF